MNEAGKLFILFSIDKINDEAGTFLFSYRKFILKQKDNPTVTHLTIIGSYTNLVFRRYCDQSI